jgi:hypothetical protein
MADFELRPRQIAAHLRDAHGLEPRAARKGYEREAWHSQHEYDGHRRTFGELVDDVTHGTGGERYAAAVAAEHRASGLGLDKPTRIVYTVSMTDQLTVGQQQDGLVIRKARKPHRCDHWERDEGEPDRMGVLPRRYCDTPIRPGDTYLEYLGESPAFQSGYAYCAEHALAEWQVTL